MKQKSYYSVLYTICFIPDGNVSISILKTIFKSVISESERQIERSRDMERERGENGDRGKSYMYWNNVFLLERSNIAKIYHLYTQISIQV